ncbi:uncharacterized protein LOC116065853 [Sander lucioperca]|uniref:uncharacterized protein LOC116065853 n=1 Tax=Sander lucioperca TaxID=283035 RepID=UPI00125D2C50|nr:uncharacterized protein LOC116065853 [Sander lucioperca]
MLLYLFLLFSPFIALGSMNSINPESTEEHVAEGRNINLTCTYEGVINNIQWYRQYQRSRPEFLLYITEGGSIHPTGSDFSAHNDKKTTWSHRIPGVFMTENCLIPAVNIRPNNSQNVFILNIHKQHFTSVDMEKLTAILFCFTLIGNTMEDDITASSAEVFSSEGRSVTLSCTYSVKADNLQWYREDPGSAPQFLLLIIDTKPPSVKEATPPHPRLNATLNKEKNQVDLEISSAEVSDSAVYYCALHTISKTINTYSKTTH